MKFIGTRGEECVTSSLAIIKSYTKNGGLFVPENLPTLSHGQIEQICNMDIAEREAYILGLFLDDFDAEFLLEISNRTCSEFDTFDPAPLIGLSDDEFVLELIHGPTCSSFDIGMSLLPSLIEKSLKMNDMSANLIIAPTDGDGCASASEFFLGSGYDNITAFYPEHGVTELQARMIEKTSSSTAASVRATADTINREIKRAALTQENIIDLNANIVNIISNTVCIISAYCDMLNTGVFDMGEKINIAVPCSDLSAVVGVKYAKDMGLPINKIICASNDNGPFTEFLDSGIYRVGNETVKTLTPSLDVKLPLNFERLIFEILGRNGEQTAEYMNRLETEGTICVDGIKFLTKDFYAGHANDDDALDFIADYYDEFGYTFDMSTASAVAVGDDYFGETGDGSPIVYFESCSPFKQPDAVYLGISEIKNKSLYDCAARICEETGSEIPKMISHLLLNQPTERVVIAPEEIAGMIDKMIRK